MRKDVELLLKDQYSLKYGGLWEYFRASDNKLYVPHSPILDENNVLIGYKAWEIDEKGLKEHEENINKNR